MTLDANFLPHINDKSEKDTRALSYFFNLLIVALQQKEAPLCASQDNKLAITVVFAAVQGGLCQQDALVALANCLQNEEMPLYQSDGYLHFELHFQSSKTPINCRHNSQKMTLLRWFPNDISQAAIKGFLTTRSYTENEPLITSVGLWQLILSLMKQLGFYSIKQFSQFCSAASLLFIRHKNASLPGCFAPLLSGKIFVSSMPLGCFHAFLNLKTTAGNLQSNTSREHVSESEQHAQNSSRDATPTPYSFRQDQKASVWKDKFKSATTYQHTEWKEHTLNHFHHMSSAPHPQSVAILIAFMKQKLSAKWKSSSSPRTFLSEIGYLWLNHTTDVDLLDVDEESIKQLIIAMASEISGEKREDANLNFRFKKKSSIKNKCERLLRLLNFAMQTFDVAQPDSYDPEDVNIPKYVRPIVIPITHFQHARYVLKDMLRNELEIARNSVDLMLLLMYKLGLRPKEVAKLQLSDIEPTNEWLFIRDNKYGKNKRPWSLRRMPLRVFLEQREFDQFADFVKHRRYKKSKHSEALLFSKAENSDIPFTESEINRLFKYATPLNKRLNISVYQCRHSFLTQLMLCLFLPEHLAGQLTHYRAKKIRHIKTAFGANTADYLWQLCEVMGHLSPATTLFSYTHGFDLILHHYANQNVMLQPKGFWQNLIQDDAYLPNNDAASHINSSDLRPTLFKALSSYAEKYANIDSTHYKSPRYITKKPKPSIEHCIATLSLFDRGMNKERICERLPVDSVYAPNWITAAKYIKEHYQTNRGNYRLYPNGSIRLSPPKPQTQQEIELAERLLAQCLSLYDKKKKILRWVMDYTLSNTLHTHSHIKFKELKDLKAFMKIILPLLKRENLQLRIINDELLPKKYKRRIPRKEMEKLGVQTVTDVRVPKNSVYLYYRPRLTKQTQSEKKGYSGTQASQVLQYVFHVLAIYLRGLKEQKS